MGGWVSSKNEKRGPDLVSSHNANFVLTDLSDKKINFVKNMIKQHMSQKSDQLKILGDFEAESL